MSAVLQVILKNFHYIILLNAFITGYKEYNDFTKKLVDEEKEVRRIEANIKQKMARNRRAKNFKSKLDESRKRILESEKEIEDLKKRLPSTIQDTEILNIFKEEQRVMGLADVKYRTLEEQKRDFYTAKRYQMQGRGTFLQLLVFFERIEKAERLFNITDLEIYRPKQTPKGRFQIVLFKVIMEVFKYDGTT